MPATLVPPASPAHELKTLVLSRHPTVVVESAEEDRVETVLRAVAADLGLPLFEWTITRGLARHPSGAPIYGTQEPAQALANIAQLEHDALFLLTDFAAHLAAPASSRAFRDLADRFGAGGGLSTLVLAGARVELPPEVESAALRYDLPTPDRDEYRRTLVTAIDELRTRGRAKVSLGADEVDELARAVAGMTLNQARQAVARAAIEDGALTSEDLGRVVSLKAQALAEEGVLEFFPAADNRHQLGGFGRLKSWLQRAHVSFGEEAAAVGLAAPRGALIVGCRAAASPWPRR